MPNFQLYYLPPPFYLSPLSYPLHFTSPFLDLQATPLQCQKQPNKRPPKSPFPLPFDVEGIRCSPFSPTSSSSQEPPGFPSSLNSEFPLGFSTSSSVSTNSSPCTVTFIPLMGKKRKIPCIIEPLKVDYSGTAEYLRMKSELERSVAEEKGKNRKNRQEIEQYVNETAKKIINIMFPSPKSVKKSQIPDVIQDSQSLGVVQSPKGDQYVESLDIVQDSESPEDDQDFKSSDIFQDSQSPEGVNYPSPEIVYDSQDSDRTLKVLSIVIRLIYLELSRINMKI